MTNKQIPSAEPDDETDVGVFGFAKKTATLLVPMAIIAGLFAVWLRSELLIVRQEFAAALVAQDRIAKQEMVMRTEFETLKLLINERWEHQKKSDEMQQKAILTNTIYLERIGQKLGLSRNVE